jgi:hypothetical protein
LCLVIFVFGCCGVHAPLPVVARPCGFFQLNCTDVLLEEWHWCRKKWFVISQYLSGRLNANQPFHVLFTLFPAHLALFSALKFL